MKLLYFDTETTGVDPKKHEIVQFSAIVEIDGEIVDEIDIFSKPTRPEDINPQALQVTGKTLEDLNNYPDSKESFKKIKEFFDKHINKYDKGDKFFPAGHNVGFDLEFLQNYFVFHGDIYGTGTYQNWQCLDTRVLANFLMYQGKLTCANAKLETLCQHFNIPLDAHNALNDIRATRTLMKKMLEV